jgi:hypothetical protein
MLNIQNIIMKTIFDFPEEVRKFARKQKIRTKDIEEKIMTIIEKDLVDNDYNPEIYEKIIIVVNGISFSGKNKVFISPKKISRKKPIRTATTVYTDDYTIRYLVFKNGLD